MSGQLATTQDIGRNAPAPSEDRFAIVSRHISADADRIEIALAARGLRAERHPIERSVAVAPPLSVTWHRPGRADVVLSDVKVALELLDEVFPDRRLHPLSPEARASHRSLIELGVVAQDRLATAVLTRHQVQHDVAVHHLRQALNRAERTATESGLGRGQPFSNVDVIFAPTLWRLRLLDREWRSFLLHGLHRLTDWADALEDNPYVSAVLTPARGTAFIGDLVRERAFITGQDHATGWQSILRLNRVRGAG